MEPNQDENIGDVNTNITKNQEELKRLGELIEAGQQVEETLKTNGWKNHISKLLDKMIVDVIGSKENGRWHNGSLLIKTRDDMTVPDKDELSNLISYKKALTDFHMQIYTYIDNLRQSKIEYQQLQEEEMNPTYELGDGGYGQD